MVSADGSRVASEPNAESEVDVNIDRPEQSESTRERSPSAAALRRERKQRAKEERKRAKIARQVLPFQSDAVELEFKKVAGGARWTLYISILLICSTVAWAYFSRIDKIVISQGELVPFDAPIIVQPSVSAPISSINVRLFDRVKAGQLIAVLDPTFTDSDIAQLKSDISKAEAKIARLDAELEEKPFLIADFKSKYLEEQYKYIHLDLQAEYSNYLYRQSHRNAKLSEYLATLDKLKVKKDSDTELVGHYKEMKEINASKVKKLEELVERKSGSPQALDDARLEHKRYHTEVMRTQGQIKQALADLVATGANRDSFEAEWKSAASTDKLEALKELDKSVEALKKAEYNKTKSKIYVPMDTPHSEFYVIQIAERTVGSMVQAGEPLMRLMPIDAQLEAEVDIMGKDIGLLSVDDELDVRVKMNSYEYQKYGTLTGRIRTISEGTVEKPGGQGAPAVSVYKARITIDFENSEKFTKPRNFNALPGMTVVTDIKVGDRRVIEYFLYPFLKPFDTAAREP